MMKPFAFFDNIRDGRARHYHDFIFRESLCPETLDSLDELLFRGWANNLHCTLRIPYEFGYPLNRLPGPEAALCIDWYRHCTRLDKQGVQRFFTRYLSEHQGALQGLLITPRYCQDKPRYDRAIASIQERIRAGEIYQINHTDTLEADFAGDPLLLYAALRARQNAPYAAFIAHSEDQYTLSLSPECFLSLRNGKIHAEPMKGTASRPLRDEELPRAIRKLAEDPKNRAENTMIVDLLRNDLAKIAEPNSIRVRAPFDVTDYGRVLQMTTRIEATLRKSTTMAEIICATFPCGSITGAPKRMAMQVIEKIECRPRGLYTGAIGYLEPEGEQIAGTFNVAIRTLCIDKSKASFGVGGGITIDSTPDDEYQECRTKAAFLDVPPKLTLMETLLVVNGTLCRLEKHYHRLQESARSLGLPAPPPLNELHASIRETLDQYQCADKLRLKLLLNANGFEKRVFPYSSARCAAYCLLADEPLANRDPLRRFKTNYRAALDRAWQFAENHNAFDALLFNTNDELLEGGRSNVFLCVDGTWHTPSLTLDILPGVMRTEVLENPELIGTDHIYETRLKRKDVLAAEKILLTNSLRGIMEVALLPNNKQPKKTIIR